MRRRVTIISLVVFGVVSAVTLFLLKGQPVQSSGLDNISNKGARVLAVDDVYLPIIINNVKNNDCSVIQNAINALPASGGQVILSTGTFYCDTAVVINRDNVYLHGQGPATILYLVNGSDSPVLVVGDTATPPTPHQNIHISDLTIDGNKAGQTQECWGGPCDTGGLTVIRNNGITLRGVSDVTIERVAVYRARSGGLVTEKVCRRLTVQNFTSAENEFDGLAAYQTENSVFSELHLHDNPYAGISLDIDFNNNIISEAVITDNNGPGIFMRDSRDNLFSDIQIRNSQDHGLFLAQADDSSTPAAGNTFHGLVVSNSSGAGMRVNDASCVNNLVVAAQFINNSECISEPTPGLVEQSAIICR